MDDSSQAELNVENEDEIEYVVERLETDDDEPIEFEDVKGKIQVVSMEQEEEEEEMDNSRSNEDSPSVIKKIKLSPEVIMS